MNHVDDRLKSKIDAMTLKELKDYQASNCLFCQIVSHMRDAHIVYEDEKVLAILDIRPANKGHVLILPKEHFMILPQIESELLSHLFKLAKKISKAMISGLRADGTNVYSASGAAAGQSAEHAIIHVIPRFKHDDLHNFRLKQVKADDLSDVLRDLE